MSWVAAAGWLAAVATGYAGWMLWRAGARQAEHVARAAHELRGPIGAVRLGVEFGCRTGRLSPERLRALELELARATQAIDDLNRVPGRAARGARAPGIPAEEVHIAALLADCVEAWRPVAKPREISLELGMYPSRSQGPVVLGVRLRLAQATGNLIANAIEHSDGPITVRLRAGRAVVRIEVIDSGCGLGRPLADLVSSRRNGTGWRPWGAGRAPRLHGHGLRIVSSVAGAHGGRLLSAPSQSGARLVLELPLAVRSARAAG